MLVLCVANMPYCGTWGRRSWTSVSQGWHGEKDGDQCGFWGGQNWEGGGEQGKAGKHQDWEGQRWWQTAGYDGISCSSSLARKPDTDLHDSLSAEMWAQIQGDSLTPWRHQPLIWHLYRIQQGQFQHLKCTVGLGWSVSGGCSVSLK